MISWRRPDTGSDSGKVIFKDIRAGIIPALGTLRAFTGDRHPAGLNFSVVPSLHGAASSARPAHGSSLPGDRRSRAVVAHNGRGARHGDHRTNPRSPQSRPPPQRAPLALLPHKGRAAGHWLRPYWSRSSHLHHRLAPQVPPHSPIERLRPWLPPPARRRNGTWRY